MARTFYFADENFKSVDYISTACSIDIEIGEVNDFSLTVPLSEYDPDKHKENGYIYSPGTELGGRLTKPTINTANKTVSFKGICFRGLLQERYVLVPTGQDYKTVQGELNSVIRNITANALYGGLFSVSSVNTGITVNETQLNRYDSCLESMNSVLDSVDYKLAIDVGERVINDYIYFGVEISATPVIDHSEEIENSQDGQITFKIAKASSFPYTYAILLGGGELKDRIVVLCSVSQKGELTEVDSIPDGKNTRVFKYDYPNAKDKTELLKQAKEKIKKELDTSSQSITLNAFMVELGDLVGGRDYITGINIVEPVTNVIYKQSYGVEEYSYKIGVDSK